jgi:hypothetical protein
MFNLIRSFFARRASKALAREIHYHMGAIDFHRAAIEHKRELKKREDLRLLALGSMV